MAISRRAKNSNKENKLISNNIELSIEPREVYYKKMNDT